MLNVNKEIDFEAAVINLQGFEDLSKNIYYCMQIADSLFYTLFR